MSGSEWTGAKVAAAAVAVLVCAAAAPLSLEGRPIQGGLIEGHTGPGVRIWQDDRPVRIAPDGRFLLGFAFDAPPRTVLRVQAASGEVATEVLDVAVREYETQRIEGLPPEQVSPGPGERARIEAEQARLAEVRLRETATPLFTGPFGWPVTGAVSGLYGSGRVLNGEPRAPHLGLDIAAAAGTPVVAPAAGVVALVSDMFLTGKTVVLDHGLGLTSVYAHLGAAFVAEGDKLAAGDRLGLVGASGRATAPHLHWGVHLDGIALDPALLAGPMRQPPGGAGALPAE